MYSKDADQVFCFCCKLFESKRTGQLCNEGTRNWKNISSKIRNHETTREHVRRLEHKNLISQFASQKARKIDFK